MSILIHPTAIIEDGARLAEGVEIGPFSIIRSGVKIGAGTKILSSVVIEGDTQIGEGNTIGPFTSIGLSPQDLKYKGENTKVVIGSNNTIREYATVHRASVDGDGITAIGDNNFLMAYVHIAHDCKVGSRIIMANAATLGGHVTVGDSAVFGGLAGVHQFCRIGTLAMVGGLTAVIQDVPPFMIAAGPRATLFGLNRVGLKRAGKTEDAMNDLMKAYKILFREKSTPKTAIKKVQEELPFTDEIKVLVDFMQNSKRGICKDKS